MEPTMIPFTMALTPATERVLATLQTAGMRPYIVGGSVRDAVMGGGTPKDIDIEVYGANTAQVSRALQVLGHVDEVGRSFGVLKLRIGREDFDISLPRRDSHTGSGHRGFTVEVDPNLSLFEATARRDFTINALMYDHAAGEIIDLHSGLLDLRARYLRHVSDAFDEDPLRVLRGVQMAARFSMRLHPSTIEKAASLRERYGELAVERVQVEFQKLYAKGHAFDLALDALHATGWDRLFPGLAVADQALLGERLGRARELLANANLARGKREVLLAATFVSVLQPADRRAFLRYTTIGDEVTSTVRQLSDMSVPELTPAVVRVLARRLPRDFTVRELALYRQLLGETELAEQLRHSAVAAGVLDGAERDLLDGQDILAAHPGRKPGPWVGQLLNLARATQYAETFRNRQDALAWLAGQAPNL